MKRAHVVPLVACTFLLARTAQAAEGVSETRGSRAPAESGAGPSGADAPITDAPPEKVRRGAGTRYVVGAVVLVAAVVATVVGLSRKRKVRVFRPGRGG